MDSLSQIVLGAAVGEAVLGKKIGARAALWGAIAGTIPDLDVFFNYTHSFLEAQQLHRGFSHSFVFSVLAAPLLAWIMSRIHRRREVDYKDWVKLAFLGLVTHPLLDNFTTWGTEFFWPFSDYRIAFNSIFVIDPIYTLPFMFFLIWALFMKRDNPRRSRMNWIGIIWSTTYLMLGVVTKQFINANFEEALEAKNVQVDDYMTRPSPLNTILWYGIAKSGDDFYVGYSSILDSKKMEVVRYPSGHHLLEKYGDNEDLAILYDFSKGFYTVQDLDTAYQLNDMRFGQLSVDPDPDAPYVFTYIIKEDSVGSPIVLKGQPDLDNIGESFKAIWERLKGN